MRYSVKLFLSILILLALTLSVSGCLLMFSSFSTARTQTDEHAQRSYRLLEYTAAAAGIGPSGLRVDDMISVLGQMELEHGSRIRVRQGENILYDSGRGPAAFDDGLISHASENTVASRVFTDDDGAHYLQMTGYLPIKNPAIELDGVFSIEAPYEALHNQQGIYGRVFSLTMLFGVIIAALLQYWLTKPLKRLSAAAKEIADGGLSVRADENGGDEFAALASDFNRMTDRLTDEMRRQKDFTGAFAHEMKTPMTSIIGYADMLRSRRLDEETRYQAANYIFTEGRRLENLSFKLLDLLVMQKRDFTLSNVELSRFVRDIAAEVRPGLKEYGITLMCGFQKGRADIEPDLMKTLILNLIDNSRKAMPDGGTIELLQMMIEDGFIISVRDTGGGIPEEELSRITEAFYRVDKSRSRAQGGVGLGLAICSEIAELHGGRLKFESTQGKGTTASLIVRGRDV